MAATEKKKDVILQGELDLSPSELPCYPFRTEIKTSTNEEVDRLNKLWKLKGAKKLEYADEALKRLSGMKSASKSRLLSFIYHPDERVPLKLLSLQTSRVWNSIDEATVRNNMAARILGEVEATGVYATPLVDKMLAGHLWAHLWYSKEKSVKEVWEDKNVSSTYFPEGYPQPMREEEVLAPVVEWIQAQQETDELKGLMGFKYYKFYQLLAQHSQVFDRKYIASLLRFPLVGSSLAKNKHFDDSWIPELKSWAMCYLKGTSSGLRRDYSRAPFGRTNFSGSFALPARSTLQEINSRREKLTPTDYEALTGIIEGTVGSRRAQAFYIVKELGSDFPGSLLFRVYEQVKEDPDSVHALVRHPSATVEFWRKVLSETRVHRVREFLANQEEAREDPEIWQTLERSQAGNVLKGLMADAAGEEFRTLFFKLVESSPASAISVLEDSNLNEKIDMDVLEPLFFHEKPRTRLNAMLSVYSDKVQVQEGERQRVKQIIDERFEEAFTEYAEESPERAYSFLKYLDEKERIPELSPDALRPLLASSDREIRMKTMTLIGELSKKPIDTDRKESKENSGRTR